VTMIEQSVTPVTFKPDDRVEWNSCSRAPQCTKTITSGVKGGGWISHRHRDSGLARSPNEDGCRRRIDFNWRENVNQAVLTNL